MSAPTDPQRDAIEHFERLGRALAEIHVPEPRPMHFQGIDRSHAQN